MQKRHFEALARALAQSKPTTGNAEHEWQWAQDVRAIACVLAQFNPLFKLDRFLQACGIPE